MKSKIIFITMGDPNGVGPEICLSLLSKKVALPEGFVPVIVGDPEVLRQAQELLKTRKLIVEISSLASAPMVWPKGIPVYSAGIEFTGQVEPGKVTREAGEASIGWVHRAVELIQQKKAVAMVTGPLCKESVELTVPGFQGHTEYIGAMCGDPEPVLALVHGNWVVAHVSTHCSLKEAVERVQKKRILKVAKLLHDFLQKYKGIRKPHLGIAGLNPHAGEEGLFGQEEIKEIRPTVKALQKAGINAEGPLPGDVIFPQLRAERFDGVVAMFHDQGHIVTKTLFFDLKGKAKVGGVNTTLGIPVLRTSVDHGTGFDIAWKGKASDLSLRDALLLAAKLS